MSATTIKVDGTVRDRLASVARARGTSMGALLAEAADHLAEEQRWIEINAAYERVRREDPEGWQRYLMELAAWDCTAEDGLPVPPENWPEYNR